MILTKNTFTTPGYYFNYIFTRPPYNILHAKREEYQDNFARSLYVHVLGYTLKPQPGYNLVLEQKSTSDSTKSNIKKKQRSS